jgi:hypothetical protein
LQHLLKEGAGLVGTIFQQIWNSGMALLDIAALFVVTPVVAFYLLLDWDRMVEKVDGWIPRDHVETVRDLARQIDQALPVCARAGQRLSDPRPDLCRRTVDRRAQFRPSDRPVRRHHQLHPLCRLDGRAGAGTGGGDRPVLAGFHHDRRGDRRVFAVGQFFEGNILQPRLVGSSVGLHPVWLMFALFAFGALFGFVGMLIAVPAAASVGVLVRFALSRYLDSDLYHGGQRQLNLDIGTGSEAGQSSGDQSDNSRFQ